MIIFAVIGFVKYFLIASSGIRELSQCRLGFSFYRPSSTSDYVMFPLYVGCCYQVLYSVK